MEILIFAVINTILIVLGFCFCFYIFIKYLKHLDLLKKSETINEYTNREIMLNADNTPKNILEEKEETVLKDITDITVEEVFKPR